jgi:D-lactate dehydrogenase
MKMPNVLITPHNAFNSKEAVERILNTTIENIKSFINVSPINLV